MVTVSGATAMIDTETANNQTTINTALIKSIPVQGRDPREARELLMPGAWILHLSNPTDHDS